MNNRSSNVAALKEQLETLFPGKLFSPTNSHRSVSTGLNQIDKGVTHGLMRRRIAEWVGSESSGKTTLLRSLIQHWCMSGMYVVYIDTQNKLLAADWAFVDKPESQLAEPQATAPPQERIRQHNLFITPRSNRTGKFLVARKIKAQDTLWAAEQLVRSGIFDIIILDAGSNNALNSRDYARLQRSLARSKAAFILIRQESRHKPDRQKPDSCQRTTWGCDSRFKFSWSHHVQVETALNTIIAIKPSITGTISRDGINQPLEVSTNINVTNRLFTHPQVPDRRTPKTGT